MQQAVHSTVRFGQLEACVADALLAPSLHNSQPWRFRITGPTIELIADRTRRLPVSDPLDRQLTISCGAALFNIRVGAAARGLGVAVDLLPRPEDPDLLARVSLSSSIASELPEAAQLLHAIRARQTYRKQFRPKMVPPAVTAELERAAVAEHACLFVFDTPLLRAAAINLVTQADEALWNDPHWRRELSQWMYPSRQGEGFTIAGLGQLAAELVTRSFDLGNGVAARDAQLLDGSPLLALIGTDDDTARSWLACGQGLQRVLLFVRLQGLQASFLNAAVCIEQTRNAMRSRLPCTGFPQVLLRVGYPVTSVEPTPRRTLESVLAIDWFAETT